jgi:hypothetical protein
MFFRPEHVCVLCLFFLLNFCRDAPNIVTDFLVKSTESIILLTVATGRDFQTFKELCRILKRMSLKTIGKTAPIGNH